jgi:lysozyme
LSYEKIKDDIRNHEGYRDKVYKDSLGHRTIGIGHLCLDHEKWVDDKVYPRKVIEKTFEYDFNIALNDARKLIVEENIHPDAFGCLINLCFNIGGPRASRFKKALSALEKQDYKVAAIEFLDSRWAKQVPNRAHELAKIMRNI